MPNARLVRAIRPRKSQFIHPAGYREAGKAKTSHQCGLERWELLYLYINRYPENESASYKHIFHYCRPKQVEVINVNDVGRIYRKGEGPKLEPDLLESF